MPEIVGAVDFEHVGFSYEEGINVLDDVSFHICPGETIALVGPTGAGKTTIVNLISRFYDIQQGTIKIDGQDIKKVSIESLRQQMGIMTQDNFLFTGTIRENIAYGKLDATDDEIIAAAKAVHAHDFITKLPDGYNTKLEERGGGLSVGQKQLLAFARTMVSMPKILILDEATSSIDTKTELLVQDGIEALLKGRTSFVIAHRLSTIQKADRIFVIDNGGIAEQGTAKELMAKRGAYYRLYTAQLQDFLLHYALLRSSSSIRFSILSRRCSILSKRSSIRLFIRVSMRPISSMMVLNIDFISSLIYNTPSIFRYSYYTRFRRFFKRFQKTNTPIHTENDTSFETAHPRQSVLQCARSCLR